MVGGTLTATSIGITVRVLTDLGRRHSVEGQIILGAAVLLGGFAAGLALSRRFFLPFGIALAADHHFSDLILSQMKPIVRLFTPIFFVMVGLSLDLRVVDWGSTQNWVVSLALLVVAIAGKFGGAMCISQPRSTQIAIGMGMVPRGEVGLVFAELGRVTGILDPGTYAILVLVIAYTTLLAPFWIKSFYKRHADTMELSISEPGHQYAGPAGTTVGPGPARD